MHMHEVTKWDLSHCCSVFISVSLQKDFGANTHHNTVQHEALEVHQRWGIFILSKNAIIALMHLLQPAGSCKCCTTDVIP